MQDTLLINFTDLSVEEKKMVLEWRNHPDTRKWMYTQDEISLENHLNFIESLKIREDKLYFIVKKDDNYIGVVDFYNFQNDSCEFGLYSNPNKLGVGKIMMNEIINYAFDRLNAKLLIAEVYINNEKAINLYKKFNFQETKRKIISDKEVICMELKNENR
ncbi:MAG: UDP-4-amino-4,6-dideoxy-N-acetyl-beta-L-altrosamine N-acetyltransferase [Sulfurovum sp.]